MRGRHKSLDKHLKHSIKWLEGQNGVTKIILGISEACRHRYPAGFLRHKMDVDGGIKINGYSGNGIMDIFVRINPINLREAVKLAIANEFLVQ